MATVLNSWYPSGLASIGDGTIDLDTDTLVLVLIADGHVFDAAMVTLADVDGADVLSAPLTLAGARSMIGRTLVTDTALQTFPSVAASVFEVGGVILATDGATDADRLLLHLWQREGDVEIVVVTDGGDVELEFSEETDPAPLYGIVRI